ncbi:5'-nucleotidase C-terminal domain-containing protein [Halomicroarcula sp. S1AR25-4]|uniref:bifunctional metallophosphatase/5'-nucleotidase n=1 Tax=Haloarcula sp. S1AR25-4 TaxID=2950538 RepID=UPI002875281D|nr:5'-nucleotidase C-terminal domain-containing protein [Halomicroarcula sp. S1AR25-4]MDS0276341.1 5'-nucleotidase C-terminal domain-containing protein [Halomicroarcula sp. S1AR25-4]
MGPRLVHYSDVENAYDDPDRIGRLAGTLQSLDGPDALLVGTGDNTAPGVLSLVTNGRQALDLFSAVDPAFETFGNHDFDHGLDATRDVVEASPQTWLTANVRNGDGRFLADETAQWAVREVAGTRIGFVGVTAPETGAASPAAEPLTFTDPFDAVVDAEAALRNAGAEYVVVLSHLGRADDDLARRSDVDVILGGHVHQRRIERVDGTLLARPGSNGHTVVTVALDGAEPTAEFKTVDDAAPDERVAGAIEDRLAETGLDEVVATVEEPISRERMDTYGGESRIGNVVADAYRWAMDTDVGLQNGGGVREDETPLSGDVTVADLVSIVPFEEPVVVAEVSGAELRTLCRQASGQVVPYGEPDWWNAHLSGLEVVWDRESRTVERLHVGGEPVDPEATYTVATTDYLLHTPVEFPVLTGTHRVDVGALQYEVLAEYARAEGIDPSVTGRVVRR